MPGANGDFDCTFVTRPQSREGGDYLHRAHWPAQALGQHVPTTVVQLSHPRALEAMAKTTVLVAVMTADEDVLRVFEERRRRGLASIFEVSDDFTAFPESVPLHAFYARKDNRRLIERLCQAADAVQFSSPGLEKKFAFLNPNRTVFHNQVAELPPLPEVRPAAPLRVGWTASGGHLQDAAELAEHLAPSFRQRAPRRFQPHQLELEAMTTSPVANTLAGHGLEFQRRPTGSMADYWRFVERLDVGLAYVSERPFALGRSDGKFIEYASRGVVAICSHRGTYAETVRDGETGFLFSTPAELQNILRRLHQSRPLLEEVRQRAYRELRVHRNHRSAAPGRLQFYRSVVARAARGRPDGFRTRSPLAPSDGFSAPVSPIEGEFLQACLLQNAGEPGQALGAYFQLVQREPDAYRVWGVLAQLYAALGLTDSLQLVQRQAAETRSRAFERAFAA